MGNTSMSQDAPDKCSPTGDGIPEGFIQDLIVLEYNTARSLQWIDSNSEQIAGVFCEPIQSINLSVVPKAFLHKLRELTAARGIVLVFDEITTGFRIAPGGVQHDLNIQADLVCYGKALGGGFPVGALAGRAEIMLYVDGGVWQYGDESKPAGRRTYFAGTMCKHPLVMAAVSSVLHRIRECKHLYQLLNAKAARMASSINRCWSEMGLALCVEHYGSQFRFVLPPNLVTIFNQTIKMNGVHFQENRSCFLSTEHTDDDVDSIIQAAKNTVVELLDKGVALPMVDPNAAVPVCAPVPATHLRASAHASAPASAPSRLPASVP